MNRQRNELSCSVILTHIHVWDLVYQYINARIHWCVINTHHANAQAVIHYLRNELSIV